jgi:hypothetical protein
MTMEYDFEGQEVDLEGRFYYVGGVIEFSTVDMDPEPGVFVEEMWVTVTDIEDHEDRLLVRLWYKFTDFLRGRKLQEDIEEDIENQFSKSDDLMDHAKAIWESDELEFKINQDQERRSA